MKKLNLIASAALLALLVVPASLLADDSGATTTTTQTTTTTTTTDTSAGTTDTTTTATTTTTASGEPMYSDSIGSGDTVGLQFDTRPVGSRYWLNSKNAWADNDRILRINPYGVLYQGIEGLQARTPEPAPVYNPDDSMVGMNPYQMAGGTRMDKDFRYNAAYENHRLLRNNPYGTLYKDIDLM
ncbi:MAG: hypothetical protein IT210_26800 [Armatimonadetes bacterium]|nr:hypothetical protein [Armatimonadota bacterium]